MKIVYLITGLRLGGAEKQLLLLAENMKLSGFEVAVIAMESGGVMAAKFREKDIRIFELGISGAISLLKAYKDLKRLVYRLNPDLIHAHMIHANLFANVFKLFNPRFKLIITAHNIREGSKALMQGYRLAKTIPSWSTNVSAEAYESFIAGGYFHKMRSSYVPNAIDTELYSADSEKASILRRQLGLTDDVYVFLTAGRLHKQKNQQMLLEAFQLFLTTHANATLLIAGEGDLDAMLKQFSDKLGIPSKVMFLGRRDDMPALINMCDCFVLSSLFEGFGLVVAEAMASERPVIATDCGGVKEVMGGFGKLVGVNDIGAMVDAMLEIHANPYSSGYMAKAREYILNNYSISVVMDEWLRLYRRYAG